MPEIEKVAIIGLDGAEPSLVFDRWLDDLPHLRRLTEGGLHGCLESCVPPLTVPAWSCMASGRDPGVLGVYGFRNRRDWSYENLGIATNLEIRHPRLWDLVGRAGFDSIVVGVPQTFPFPRPLHGCQVTGFLTPSTDSPYTHPPELAREIAGLVGDYIIDVSEHRTADKEWLLGQLELMSSQRFQVARHLITTRPWKLFWMVDMGVDRLHHGFWHFMDPAHRRYEPHQPLGQAIHDYYVMIDQQIGGLLDVLDLERTAVWIVSDHGGQRLDGGFCLNDWLIREGLLTMKTPVTERRRFELADVDWSRTKVWGEGGYVGQCFINRAGREPRGVVPTETYEDLRDALTAGIEALTDPEGRPLKSHVYKPEELYQVVNGFPPDLIVHFGDLHWRAVSSIGHPDLFTCDHEAGPDDANHSHRGLYVLSHGAVARGRRDATLYDVAPTTLDLMGLNRPRGLRGQSLVKE